MKKLFFALVTAAALVSFASCGGNSSKGSKDAGDGKPTTEDGTEFYCDEEDADFYYDKEDTEFYCDEEDAECYCDEGDAEFAEVTIEGYAVDMFKKMYAAGENNDLEKFTELAKEFDNWLNYLSESEQKKVQTAVMAWDQEKAEMVIDAANQILY